MSNFPVKKVAILGAGVMGAQIAAHCVNARVPVILFDLPGKDGQSRNALAERAVEQLKKLNPAPLADAAHAGLIEVANFDDHLDRLQQADLVIAGVCDESCDPADFGRHPDCSHDGNRAARRPCNR